MSRIPAIPVINLPHSIRFKKFIDGETGEEYEDEIVIENVAIQNDTRSIKDAQGWTRVIQKVIFIDKVNSKSSVEITDNLFQLNSEISFQLTPDAEWETCKIEKSIPFTHSQNDGIHHWELETK